MANACIENDGRVVAREDRDGTRPAASEVVGLGRNKGVLDVGPVNEVVRN